MEDYDRVVTSTPSSLKESGSYSLEGFLVLHYNPRGRGLFELGRGSTTLNSGHDPFDLSLGPGYKKFREVLGTDWVSRCVYSDQVSYTTSSVDVVSVVYRNR